MDAGLRVIGTNERDAVAGGSSSGKGGGGGGFKKGGFKSSFTAVKGPEASTIPAKKNVLGDDDENDEPRSSHENPDLPKSNINNSQANTDAESDTDEEYGGTYYDPRRPTECGPRCPGPTNFHTLVS